MFNEPLGRYAEKQAEKFPEYGAIRKLLGLDERRKEMEAAKAGAEKIQANILNAVTVAVQANEAEIARQLGVAVDQRMPIWLKQVGILFDAKLAQQNFQNFAGGVGNQAIKGQQ